MHLDIDTNMKMIGKRIPYYATYKVNHTISIFQNGSYMYVWYYSMA